jgi:hypothetical protein
MFWTPAFAGVTIPETFYEIIKVADFNPKNPNPLTYHSLQ